MNKVIDIKESKEKFLKLLQSETTGGSISLASKKCALSRQTIYNWREKDEKFDEAVCEASLAGKECLADIAEQALIERVKAKDTTAIIFTLKSLRREHYASFQEVKDIKSKRWNS